MIKKLLRLEFYKSFGYTNFWVFAGLWLGLYFLVLLILLQVNAPLPGMETKPYLQFPLIWSTCTWIASWFNLLLGIMIIVSVGNEYSFKTFRSLVINGLSRTDLVTGKVLFITFLAFCSVFLLCIFTIIFGLIFTTFGNDTSVFSKSYLVFVYFIQSVAYMSMGMFIAILLKNTALSIVSFILYFFPIEAIIRNFFPETIQLFFPVKIISNLTPLPDILHFGSMGQMTTSVNGQPIEQAISTPPPELSLYITTFIAIGYIILFISASNLLLKKRNL